MEPASPMSDTDQVSAQKARRRRLGWIALALIVAGLVVVAAVGWTKYHRLRPCLDSSLAHLRALQDLAPQGGASAADLDLAEAGAHLHGLQADLLCVQEETRGFLPWARLFGWLPKVGPTLASAPDLLEMAQALVDGGVLAFDGLEPLIGAVQSGDLDLPRTVATLDAAQPALIAAQDKLERAAELQSRLAAVDLHPRVGQLLDLTGQYLPLLRLGVEAAQLAPELLGAQQPRTYLILAQNDDERRPTGGWISGVGLVTVAGGEVADLSFQDSFAVDNLSVPHETPPESMLRTLWAELWLLRDANWSPDFPTSAQVAERILQNDQGVAVDGVIAVDQQALQLLVTALEPLQLAAGEEPVTGANVLATIRDAWAEPLSGQTPGADWQAWEAHRKDFMPDLVTAMLAKVQQEAGGLDLRKVATSVLQALRQRHILIYLHQERAAGLLAARHWDGAILETEGDYLQVVDANVGFNKVDPNVRRSLAYQVDLTSLAQPRAGLLIHYENQSQRPLDACVQGIEWQPLYTERMQGCYWDFVRVYVPQGAQLLTAGREPLPPGSLLARYQFAPLGDAGPSLEPPEKGKGAFGLFFDLLPGEARDVDLAWRLPAGTIRREADGWHYQLLVQKQSGAAAIPARVSVLLPPGAPLVAATPAPQTAEGNMLTFELSLAEDRRVQIVFGDGGTSTP
jgi:hypothetical protein